MRIFCSTCERESEITDTQNTKHMVFRACPKCGYASARVYAPPDDMQSKDMKSKEWKPWDVGHRFKDLQRKCRCGCQTFHMERAHADNPYVQCVNCGLRAAAQ